MDRRGINNGGTKRSSEQVLLLKIYHKYLGASAKQLSELLHIPLRSVYYVISGEGWNHIYLPNIEELTAENWRDLGEHLLLTFFQTIEEVYIKEKKPIPGDVIKTLMKACTNLGLPDNTLNDLKSALHSFCSPSF